jgi:hypothetical protein
VRALLAALCLLWWGAADAKQAGFNSPKGRRIYTPDETFRGVLDQDTRDFVVEVAVGSGPEGNLGLVVGWLAKEVKGVELYAGVGFEALPSLNYTGAVRYLMNFSGYRPYVGAGYLFQRMPELETRSHNAFVETGYSWKLRYTYHLTAGIGLRYMMDVSVEPGSPLSDETTDPAFLEEQLDDLKRWAPTFALRFSRAF